MTRHMIAPSRALVIVSTIVVALVLLLASGVGATGDMDIHSTEQYTVRSGDTLWEIAEDHASRGRDVRDVVAAIRSINRLSESVIYPGQTLEVPSNN